MAQEGRYIYCVIPTGKEKNFGPIGIGGQNTEVYTIPHQDMGVVVSNWPMIAFNAIPQRALLSHLMEYHFVIEQVMNSFTVIPIKFGTMAKDAEEVKEIMESGYHQFKEALERMDKKIEFDVVAWWNNLDAILREMGEGKKIKRFKEEIASSPSIELQSKIELGKLVKAALDKKRDKISRQIVDELNKCASDFCAHDLLDDTMIMNRAFLVDKNRQKGFEEKVDYLNKEYEEKINFRIIGSLPPYSFSTFEVKRVEFQEMEEARRILGLSRGIACYAPTQIKEAYRRLIHKFHPDKNPGNPDAQKQFKKITEAYNTLFQCYQGDLIPPNPPLLKGGRGNFQNFITVRLSVIPRRFQ